MVLCRRQRSDRGHVDAGAAEPVDLARVVRQQLDRAHAEAGEHGSRIGVVAGVDRESEADVGVDGVGTVVLLDVAAQLVDEPDPAALVTGDVDEHAAALGGDRAQRQPQLLPAVAAQ